MGEGGGTPTVRLRMRISNGGGGGNLENAWVKMGIDVGFVKFSPAPFMSSILLRM